MRRLQVRFLWMAYSCTSKQTRFRILFAWSSIHVSMVECSASWCGLLVRVQLEDIISIRLDEESNSVRLMLQRQLDSGCSVLTRLWFIHWVGKRSPCWWRKCVPENWSEVPVADNMPSYFYNGIRCKQFGEVSKGCKEVSSWCSPSQIGAIFNDCQCTI